MKGAIAPVSIDQFLELEEEARRLARLRAPAREVRRFHAAVRRFATAWCQQPGRRLAAKHTANETALQLEIEDRYGWVPVLSLRAIYGTGEFCLHGPFPGRKKIRLSAVLRKGLEQLNKTWRTLPGAEESDKLSVVVHLPKLADSGFDRFLETAIDACSEIG